MGGGCMMESTEVSSGYDLIVGLLLAAIRGDDDEVFSIAAALAVRIPENEADRLVDGLVDAARNLKNAASHRIRAMKILGLRRSHRCPGPFQDLSNIAGQGSDVRREAASLIRVLTGSS